jgi:hypothetical protein
MPGEMVIKAIRGPAWIVRSASRDLQSPDIAYRSGPNSDIKRAAVEKNLNEAGAFALEVIIAHAAGL